MNFFQTSSSMFLFQLPWKFYKSVADLLGISRYFLMSGLYFWTFLWSMIWYCYFVQITVQEWQENQTNRRGELQPAQQHPQLPYILEDNRHTDVERVRSVPPPPGLQATCRHLASSVRCWCWCWLSRTVSGLPTPWPPPPAWWATTTWSTRRTGRSWSSSWK